eukprot:10844366-Heterocapsa_arctica.AAC.1
MKIGGVTGRERREGGGGKERRDGGRREERGEERGKKGEEEREEGSREGKRRKVSQQTIGRWYRQRSFIMTKVKYEA